MNKLFRWVLAVVVPFLILIGMLVIYKDVETIVLPGIRGTNERLYLFVHGLENAFVFFIYVVVSCLFSPKPKKYGVIVSVCVESAFIVYLLFSSVKDKLLGMGTYRLLIVSEVGFMAGLVLGVISCSTLFKNRGWQRTQPSGSSEALPLEQY